MCGALSTIFVPLHCLASHARSLLLPTHEMLRKYSSHLTTCCMLQPLSPSCNYCPPLVTLIDLAPQVSECVSVYVCVCVCICVCVCVHMCVCVCMAWHTCRMRYMCAGGEVCVCVEWVTCAGRCCDGCTSLQVLINCGGGGEGEGEGTVTGVTPEVCMSTSTATGSQMRHARITRL